MSNLKNYTINIGTTLDPLPVVEKKNDQEFTKYDQGKLRWHLIPWDALEEVLKVLEHGATIHGDFNWEKGTDWTRIGNSLQRHKVRHDKGFNLDADTNLPELAHLICNALFLLSFQLRGLGKDDRRANNKK